MISIKEVDTAGEYQECLSIRRKVFVEEQGVPLEEEIDTFEKESVHFLVHLNEKPVATGRIRLKKGFIKFERIATLPAYRGKGLASALLDVMEKTAASRFAEYLPAMHAQLGALSLYKKRGWLEVGETFQEAGIDHKAMVLLPDNLKDLKCLNDPETPLAIKEFLQASLCSR